MSALEKYKEYLLEEEKKKKAELDFKVAKAKLATIPMVGFV